MVAVKIFHYFLFWTLFVFRCWRCQHKQLSYVLLWVETTPLFLWYGFWLKVRIITLFCTAVIFLRVLLCFMLQSILYSCHHFKVTPLVFYQLSNRSNIYLQFVNICDSCVGQYYDIPSNIHVPFNQCFLYRYKYSFLLISTNLLSVVNFCKFCPPPPLPLICFPFWSSPSTPFSFKPHSPFWFRT